jgi:DNA-binding response OmpR family regulator
MSIDATGTVGPESSGPGARLVPAGSNGPIPWLVVDDGVRAAAIARSLGTSPWHYEGPRALVTALRRTGARVAIVLAPPVTAEGIDLLAAERRRTRTLRLLLIDAPAAVEERLRALGLGFDDAVPSTLSPVEIAWRARWLAGAGGRRRSASATVTRVRLGHDLELDPAGRALRRGGTMIHLRPKEYGLLALLAAHPGRVFTRRQLLDRVWGPRVSSDPRTVDVHVRWLRSKIESQPQRPRSLITVRGVGYRLDLPNR